MRIIGGIHKGRPISAPDTRDTRPTTDRVREALMSSVASQQGGFGGEVVLDCFAGSGALGLEALSRSAKSVTFFENARKPLAALKKNIDDLGFSSQATVRSADIFAAARAAQVPGGPFSIIFLDPPYATTPAQVGELLVNLAMNRCMGLDTLIVYELAESTARASDQPLFPAGFEEISQKRYGSTVIAFARIAIEG